MSYAQSLAGPTEAGFLAFLADYVGIPSGALQVGNTNPQDWAYNTAKLVVTPLAAMVGESLYSIMTYNLATHNLIRFTPDTPPSTYFADARKAFGLGGGFTLGIVQSASDSGTSTSLLVPDALKNLTLADLQLLKTPYGQAYLEFAQMFGPIWGLT